VLYFQLMFSITCQ